MNALRSPFWLTVLLLLSPFAWADDPESAVAADTVTEERYRVRSPAEIERLVGRLALYPDVLVAIMLPASRDPVEVVLAARAVRADRDRVDFDEEPWSDSIKRLARYPDALFLLDEDLEWTTELGDVFASQPADVLEAIQAVRDRAKKLGYLKNSQYQVVVERERHIYIYPCSWDYVYIPRYNWRRLYYGDYCGPNEIFISFGATGFIGGYWRGYECDWVTRRLWISPSVVIVKGGGNRHYAYRHPGSRARYVEEERSVHRRDPGTHRPESGVVHRNEGGERPSRRPEATARPERRTDRTDSEGRREGRTDERRRVDAGQPGRVTAPPSQVTEAPRPRPNENRRTDAPRRTERVANPPSSTASTPPTGPRPRDNNFEGSRNSVVSQPKYTSETRQRATEDQPTRSSTQDSRRFQSFRETNTGSSEARSSGGGGDRGNRGEGGQRGNGGGGHGRH